MSDVVALTMPPFSTRSSASPRRPSSKVSVVTLLAPETTIVPTELASWPRNTLSATTVPPSVTLTMPELFSTMPATSAPPTLSEPPLPMFSSPWPRWPTSRLLLAMTSEPPFSTVTTPLLPASTPMRMPCGRLGLLTAVATTAAAPVISRLPLPALPTSIWRAASVEPAPLISAAPSLPAAKPSTTLRAMSTLAPSLTVSRPLPASPTRRSSKMLVSVMLLPAPATLSVPKLPASVPSEAPSVEVRLPPPTTLTTTAPSGPTRKPSV